MTVLTSTEITEGLQSDLSAVTEQISRTQEYIDRYLPSVLSFGLRLLFAVIVFLVGARLIKLLRKFIRRSMERAGADVGLMQFLDSLLKVIFYFVLIMLIASGFGVDTTSVMALVGSAGLTIGLAFQGSLSNFAGGVLLLLIKPFKVGDYIIYVADNLEGTVTEVQMFYTTLLTADNRRVVIPNGVLSNNSLVNVTAQDKRRLDIDVGIGYDSDLKLAKELCEKLLNQEEKILDDQEHIVVVDSLADSAVMLKLRFWVRPEDYWATKWRMTEKVKILFAQLIFRPFLIIIHQNSRTCHTCVIHQRVYRSKPLHHLGYSGLYLTFISDVQLYKHCIVIQGLWLRFCHIKNRCFGPAVFQILHNRFSDPHGTARHNYNSPG